MCRHYTFLTSRSGETVPAIILPSGETLPLHSMVDPVREAQRLVSTIPDDTGFIALLGLGGGFTAQAVLDKTQAQVLAIDFDNEGINELLCAKDFSKLLNNERFCLLKNPSYDVIKNFILENYRPSLCGGIKTIPLRTRTEADVLLFEKAAAAIQEAIEIISSDYSVQVHFGKRWFSNIIRNIKNAENQTVAEFPFTVTEAAVVAAGPSLDQQLTVLSEYKDRRIFVICSDTALPVLLQNDIEPDTVVSIDCQQISYYHFLACTQNKLQKITLVLDIASPPLLSRFSSSPLFFSGGHPLAQYISSNWRPFLKLDTSGGNVTYACLSLAQSLGAKRITLFGADFSYVNSRTYARGTYIYPYFEKKQNRFTTLESHLSAFLYRSPFLPKENEAQNYRETALLRFYRKKLEEKAAKSAARIYCAQGYGAPVKLENKTRQIKENTGGAFHLTEKPEINGRDFLKQYRNDIAAISGLNLRDSNVKNRQILNTILPAAAAIKHRNPDLKTEEIIEETKCFCINQIDNALNN